MRQLSEHDAADPLVPLSAGRDTAQNIPGAELQVIEGMGHDFPDALLPRLALYKPDGAGPFPALVLLGGKDTETPPQECSDRLKPGQDAGEPVQWHFYAEATHCRDCKNLHGFKKVDAFRGTDVEYLYDESVTLDSAQRMFEFIEKAFANRK